MKFLLTLIAVAVLARLSVYLIPYWWGVAPGAALAGLIIARSSGQAWWGGFFGLIALWGSYATAIHLGNSGRIGGQLAELTSLSSPVLVIAATAVLGGLIGGGSCLSGFLLKKAATG